jgi:hypothetical protein
MLAAVILIYLDNEHSYLYMLAELGLFVSDMELRKKEKQKYARLTAIYVSECDPERYLLEYEKYRKSLLFPKRKIPMATISKALVYVDLGDFDTARNLLLGLADEEAKMSDFVRFWYYKAWIYCYDETKETARMKVLIDQQKIIIERIKSRYQMQLLANYQLIVARYYLRAGIYLENAETIYHQVLNGPYPKLTYVLCEFRLGEIAFLKNQYETAQERFHAVIRNGNKLYVTKKAHEFLDKIKSKTDV